ncbi:hypothetical protein AKO1_013784 [Acrasis kona]|uniref:DYW domain-containing protein n=1 Tax=Acrasis kona TaxID=1008807 RepID=A0AAW2ZJW1_9EUKA
MKGSDHKPDIITYAILLSACGEANRPDLGDELVNVWKQDVNVIDVKVYSSMMKMYGLTNRIQNAMAIFKELLSYGNINNLPQEEVINVHLQMIRFCSEGASIENGRFVINSAKRHNIFDNGLMITSTVSLYAKCNMQEEALAVFGQYRESKLCDVTTWNAIIQCFANKGRSDKAEEYFDEMIKKGIQPSNFTISILLNAYSHDFQVDKALSLFHNIHEFGITTDDSINGSIIDALGRSGRIQDAYEFTKSINSITSIHYQILLGSCRIHRDLDTAQQVFAKLRELDSLTSSDYVTLATILAHHGMWSEKEALMNAMAAQGLKRIPGVSHTTINNVLYTFTVSDTSHQRSEEIRQYLRSLQDRLKIKYNYNPNLACVTRFFDTRQEKEDHLWEHSEKLATGLNLISTKKGTPIIITKNLRMCEDCHASMKLICLEEEREISVRDAHRWHVFKDGKCDCDDHY